MKKKILVVEDDNNIRQNIVEYFLLHNFDVISSANGKLAYESAVNNKPDLIISDLLMPEMSGLELLIALKDNNETNLIPFILTTAKTEPKDVRTGMNYGADDYVTKPFQLNDLLNSVNTQLNKKDLINTYLHNEYEKSFEHWKQIANHELFTPINVIQNVFHLTTQHAALDDELENVFSTAISRLKRTISNLLLLSGVYQFSNNFVESSAVYLNAQLELILKEIVLQDKSGTIDRFKINLNTPDVFLFKEYYFLIIKELIDNAFRYSSPDTIIDIDVFIDTDNFVFKIINDNKINNNIPLSKNRAFSQIERKYYEQQGLGLGLYIVNRISDLFNCKFEIKQIDKHVECTWSARY
jgi:DNA-binding response OmpR family regulator